MPNARLMSPPRFTSPKRMASRVSNAGKAAGKAVRNSFRRSSKSNVTAATAGKGAAEEPVLTKNEVDAAVAAASQGSADTLTAPADDEVVVAAASAEESTPPPSEAGGPETSKAAPASPGTAMAQDVVSTAIAVAAAAVDDAVKEAAKVLSPPAQDKAAVAGTQVAVSPAKRALDFPMPPTKTSAQSPAVGVPVANLAVKAPEVPAFLRWVLRVTCTDMCFTEADNTVTTIIPNKAKVAQAA